MNSPPLQPSTIELEQVLQRSDIWRGHARTLASHSAVDTGYPALNAGLVWQGWPVGSLIEIYQENLTHSEWLLMTPTLLKTPGGYIVLLNPPALPFCQALIQAGLDLDRVLVVQTTNKADFLSSFMQLTRADACDAVLAWQPKQALSYTELRKCLLACEAGSGLYLLFRPASMRQQSSPATLRLLTGLSANHLQVTIFKQKGLLQTQQPGAIDLSLPTIWHGLQPHRFLDQSPLPDKAHASTHSISRSAEVAHIHRGKP